MISAESEFPLCREYAGAPLDERLLRLHLARTGPVASRLEALDAAIECEATVRALGTFDPAVVHFLEKQRAFEEVARLMERLGI